jgi:hypothetical protein
MQVNGMLIEEIKVSLSNNYVIKFVSDLRQVDGFLRVL